MDMRWSILISAAMLAAPPLQAQHGPNASAAAMQRLAFLVGEWRGPASMQMGPGAPVQVAQHELVTLAAGGTVLAIVGRGTISQGGTERVVHDAFATVWYDETAERYRMRAHLATGQTVDAEPRVSRDTLVWGFQHPQAGHIRYTVTLSPTGEWHEIGERSADGDSGWTRFLEMRLQRVP
jgi:hypothetical protein